MKDKYRGKKVRINMLMSYLEMLLKLIELAVGEDKKKYQVRVDKICDKIETEIELNEKPAES